MSAVVVGAVSGTAVLVGTAVAGGDVTGGSVVLGAAVVVGATVVTALVGSGVAVVGVEVDEHAVRRTEAINATDE